MQSFASAPGEMFYHFAKKNQSMGELIRSFYNQPGQHAIDHFKTINSHLHQTKQGVVKC